MDTKMLLEAVEARAKKDHEGHFWIMRFTTGYKGGFSTPDLDSGYGREEVLNSLESDTIDGMLIKMLTKEDGRIDWNKNAVEIERMVRGLNPWPGTYNQIEIEGAKPKNIKILEVENDILDINSYKHGETFLHESKLAVQCSNGALVVNKLQIEGKKAMETKVFLQGQKDFIGTILK